MLFESGFVTQTLTPSHATPNGLVPIEYVPRTAPSPDRSFVTLLLPLFAIHTLEPSKATPFGDVPTGIVLPV
jgi:hypothetical protein